LQGEIKKLRAEIRERAEIDEEMNSIEVDLFLRQKEELRKAKESVIKLQRLLELQNQLAALVKNHIIAALPVGTLDLVTVENTNLECPQ
jgi:hypothetical protein